MQVLSRSWLAAAALLLAADASPAAPPVRLDAPRPPLAPAELPVASDATVGARLEAHGMQYERDGDDAYRVVFAWQQEQRSQVAFIAGRAHRLGDSAVREVFSPAARVPEGGFDAARSDMLLRDSQANILGAWEIAGDVLLYVIKLHDDADGARLAQALEVAAQLADDMELRLTGEDAL